MINNGCIHLIGAGAALAVASAIVQHCADRAGVNFDFGIVLASISGCNAVANQQ